jgi:Pectate lyase superfamily protein
MGSMMRTPLNVILATLAASLLTTTNVRSQPQTTNAIAQPGSRITTFSVTDFGAVCDGKTDDTAAVQKAIDAARATGGGVVEFPTGTCMLNTCRPSSHPWFFYNLTIGSNVTLSGTTGTRLLQGPGGRHSLIPGASQVRNTVLAFGADYTVIRFQNPKYNGGFLGLEPTTANQKWVTLSMRSEASRFVPGDYVVIYESTRGDVIPTEVAQVDSVKVEAGVLALKRSLTRSFRAPSLARITSLVTANVGVRNMTVQGTEPLAVTEAVGFKAENNHFVIETAIGGGNVTGVNLNTLVDFQFIGNTFTSVGPRYVTLELTQRNSRYGLFTGNSFTGSNVGFGEYAAHLKFTENHFWIHADSSVVAGIFIGGKDVEFSHNDVHGGNVTGGSGWGVMLADFIGPIEYAPYVGQVRIADNTFDCQADGNACLGVFAADTSVTGNTIIVKGIAQGIHAEGSLPQSNLIKANALSMDSGDGILIVTPAAGGSGTVVTGNTIKGSGAQGISVVTRGAPRAGGVSVSGNTVAGFKTAVAVH